MNDQQSGRCHLRGAFLGSLHDLPRRVKEDIHKKRRPLTELLLMFMNLESNMKAIRNRGDVKTYFLSVQMQICLLGFLLSDESVFENQCLLKMFKCCLQPLT